MIYNNNSIGSAIRNDNSQEVLLAVSLFSYTLSLSSFWDGSCGIIIAGVLAGWLAQEWGWCQRLEEPCRCSHGFQQQQQQEQQQEQNIHSIKNNNSNNKHTARGNDKDKKCYCCCCCCCCCSDSTTTGDKEDGGTVPHHSCPHVTPSTRLWEWLQSEQKQQRMVIVWLVVL